jgi:predicted ATP-grasp superfamily ATP-dependent carboligase
LSVGRALGQAGVEVDVLEDGYTDCLARRSRYTRRYVNFPPEGAGDVKPRWLEWLVGAEPAVVLPCGDEGLELVARHRGELAAAGHRCIEAADDVLLTALDKPASYRLATALGVGAPRTIAVHAGEDAAVALDQGLSFPCAVKPTRSDAMLRSHPGHEAPKGAVVRDRAELDAMVRAIVSAGVVALVTELIPGGDERYC